MNLKKVFLTLIFAVSVIVVNAQNIQLHYDFGGSMYEKEYVDRPVLTSTVEMFKLDKWGSTFFFIDMDYASNGIAAGYWEIVRELKFWEGPVSAHVEYNGGLTSFKLPENSYGASRFNNAYMFGATYTYNAADFNVGYSLSAMHKYIQQSDKPHNFQITGTWYVNFIKNKLLTFTGFADFWKEKTGFADYIFLSEPQIWLHINKISGVDENFKLSIGSEVELGNNFATRKGFFTIPTAAIRWAF
jgi:hypothetical protein